MDNILVHDRDEKEHEKRFQSVLWILKRIGLKLNDRKCHLCQKQLNYLGHCIVGDSIWSDPSKVSTITELQPTDNGPGLQRYGPLPREGPSPHVRSGKTPQQTTHK